MRTDKTYPHVTGIYGDGGENEGVLAIHAVLDPSPNYPETGRIIVGSPEKSPALPGYIPDLGGFSCSPEAAERLANALLVAARDVRAAMGERQGHRRVPVLWFDHAGSGPDELALELLPRRAELDGRIPRSLGLLVRAGALVIGAGYMVDGGFLMEADQVADLHRQLGAWLHGPALPLAPDVPAAPDAAKE